MSRVETIERTMGTQTEFCAVCGFEMVEGSTVLDLDFTALPVRPHGATADWGTVHKACDPR